MKAEIINIGDEILIGQIVNTNAAWLSQKLTALGVTVDWISAVGDELGTIKAALHQAAARADIIVSTGGLGPTHDDISLKAICEFFETQLVFNAAVFQNVQNIFGRMGRNVDAVNRDQALVPEIARVLNNRIGTAPGLLIEKDRRMLFVLPGVPMEMKVIFEDHIAQIISRASDGLVLRFSTIRTSGIFESDLFTKTRDLIEQLQGKVRIASLPGPGGVNLRLMVQGLHAEECETTLANAVDLFKNRLGNFIYAFDDELMEHVVAAGLMNRNQTLAIFDGFTNGVLSQRFYALPNADKFIKGFLLNPENAETPCGLIFETRPQFRLNENHEKNGYLIAEHIKNQFQADLALAVLPEFQKENQIIVVHAILTGKSNSAHKTFQFRMEMADIKERAAQFALNFLRLHLSN